jgi:YidC/Oxa1 family membrane protein insertase
MENNKFDLKAVLAIGLGLFIWLGWQLYLNKKYPKANAAAVSTATPNTPDLAAKSTSEQNKDPNLVTSKETSKPINAPAKTFEYETDSVKFTLSSLGMGISNYSLKDHKDHSGHDILMSNGTSSDDGLFAMKLPQMGLLPFDVAEKGPGYFVGTARVGGLTISRELKFHSDTRSFESRISFSGADDSFRNGFSLIIPGKLDEQKKSSFLMPSYDHKTSLFLISRRRKQLCFQIAKKVCLKRERRVDSYRLVRNTLQSRLLINRNCSLM